MSTQRQVLSANNGICWLWLLVGLVVMWWLLASGQCSGRRGYGSAQRIVAAVDVAVVDGIDCDGAPLLSPVVLPLPVPLPALPMLIMPLVFYLSAATVVAHLSRPPPLL